MKRQRRWKPEPARPRKIVRLTPSANDSNGDQSGSRKADLSPSLFDQLTLNEPTTHMIQPQKVLSDDDDSDGGVILDGQTENDIEIAFLTAARGPRGRGKETTNTEVVRHEGEHPKPSSSPLETLPAELLELIAWHSVNPSLTRVSKTIRSKLPSELVLKRDMITVGFIERSAQFAKPANVPVQSSIGKVIELSNPDQSGHASILRDSILDDPQFTVTDILRARDLTMVSFIRQGWLTLRNLTQTTFPMPEVDDNGMILMMKKGFYAPAYFLYFSGDSRVIAHNRFHKNTHGTSVLRTQPLFKLLHDSEAILKMRNGEGKQKLLMILWKLLLYPEILGNQYVSLPLPLLVDSIRSACDAVDTTTLRILLGMADIKLNGTTLRCYNNANLYGPRVQHHQAEVAGFLRFISNEAFHAMEKYQWNMVRILIDGAPKAQLKLKMLQLTAKNMSDMALSPNDTEAQELLQKCKAYPKAAVWCPYSASTEFPVPRNLAARCIDECLANQCSKLT